MANNSQLVLKICIRQNRVLETLDSLCSSIEKIYENYNRSNSPSFEKLSRKLQKLQNRFAKESAKLKNILEKLPQDLKLGQEFSQSLEHFYQKTESLKQVLRVRYRSLQSQDYHKHLEQACQLAKELHQNLKEIDLRESLKNISGAFLVDPFENLGRAKVIQWPRKIWHTLAGLAIVWIYLFSRGTFTAKMTIFGSFTAYALICDIYRLLSPKFNARVMNDLKKFMRKEEAGRLNSMTFYTLSCFFVCLVFPKAVAILSILFLAFGDVIASVVGVKWGRHKIFRRLSLEGSLAFFATAALLTLLYPLLAPQFSGNLFLLCMVGGLVGMTSEWVSFRTDDNLMIPLYSATFLFIYTHWIA